MRGIAAHRIVFLLVMSVLASFGSGNIASAHVSADDMPDSMAKMEYRIYLEFKPDDALVRNKLGMVYFRLNKLTEADREFSTILEQKPDDYDALDGLGLVRAAQGNYAAAVRLHSQAFALNNQDMTIPYHLGTALEKKGAFNEALEAYRTALALFEEQSPSAAGDAKAAEFGRRVEAAISHLERKK